MKETTVAARKKPFKKPVKQQPFWRKHVVTATSDPLKGRVGKVAKSRGKFVLVDFPDENGMCVQVAYRKPSIHDNLEHAK